VQPTNRYLQHGPIKSPGGRIEPRKKIKSFELQPAERDFGGFFFAIKEGKSRFLNQKRRK